MAASPPPQQRYDRQVRIWGDAGQAALHRASVCVIHVTATTTELLKNLVLPGIGSFTLLDDRPVTSSLAAANLFLRYAGAGAAPEKAAHQLVAAMRRLNPHVRAACIADRSPTAILAESPANARAFLSAFTVVVLCFALNTPLLLLRTAGLAATLRLQLREHIVTDSRDPDRPPDLRATAPFAELASLVDALDLSAMSAIDATHVPFLLLLCRAVRAFRAAHGDKLPVSRDEKNEFKELVKALRPSQVPDEADNFTQALHYRFLRLCHADADALPPSVRTLFDDANADPESSPVLLRRQEEADRFLDEREGSPAVSDEAYPPTTATTDPAVAITDPVARAKDAHDDVSNTVTAADARRSFWLYVAALRSLFAQTGALPVPGTLPDMAADTSSYTRLQAAFRTAAARDVAAATARATELAEQLNGAISPPDGGGHDSGCAASAAVVSPLRVDADTLASLCKTLRDAQVVRGRSIRAELAEPSGSSFASAVEADGAASADGAGSAAPYYAALRAVDEFRERAGRPAEPSDLSQVARCAAELVDRLGIRAPDHLPSAAAQQASAPLLWREHVEETLRYGDAELHNVAAFMGGIAAQEAVKLITRLFVPVRDTLVVNFAEMRAVTFRA